MTCNRLCEITVIMWYGVATVLNLVLHNIMEKNNFKFENARFSGKGCQSLHMYTL